MKNNETKTNTVKDFINEHKTGLIIGACGITALVFGGYCYFSGRVDQYNTDARGFAKQFNEALHVVDDETKNAIVEAFNNAASINSDK